MAHLNQFEISDSDQLLISRTWL